MRLTREQFLAGVIFNRVGFPAIRYQFVAGRNDITGTHPGYIREIDANDNKHYHCQVISVDDTTLNAFTFILGEMFNHVYPLTNFVVSEKKVGEKVAS